MGQMSRKDEAGIDARLDKIRAPQLGFGDWEIRQPFRLWNYIDSISIEPGDEFKKGRSVEGMKAIVSCRQYFGTYLFAYLIERRPTIYEI